MSDIESTAALEYLKLFNLDGFKRLPLKWIAERLIETITKSGFDIPKLSRPATRDVPHLNKWFYDNRQTLTPWLLNLKYVTRPPLKVCRQKQKL